MICCKPPDIYLTLVNWPAADLDAVELAEAVRNTGCWELLPWGLLFEGVDVKLRDKGWPGRERTGAWDDPIKIKNIKILFYHFQNYKGYYTITWMVAIGQRKVESLMACL